MRLPRIARARTVWTTVLELAGWGCVCTAAWWTMPALGMLATGAVLVYLSASVAAAGGRR